MGLLTKAFKFEIKELTDKGEFTGIASVYGVEDLGGDVIEPGAFTKTLSERPEVPVLWQHKATDVIGKGRLGDNGRSLTISGTLDMEDPVAAAALRKMKKGLISGLSIGYQAVKVVWEETKDKYIRHINELKLWEVSIVTFPMLPEAQVTSVKATDENVLERAGLEIKSGRRLSAATLARMQEVMGDHQKLMSDHQAVLNKFQALLDEDATAAGNSAAGAAGGAANQAIEPDIVHSLLSQIHIPKGLI